MDVIDWALVLMVLAGLLLAFAVGFSLGRWWRWHLREGRIDPSRREWRGLR